VVAGNWRAVCGYRHDERQVIGFQAGVVQYRDWYNRTLAEPTLLIVEKSDTTRFMVEHIANSDDDSPEEAVDAMCSVHIKRATKENQSLLPRGRQDYEHPVSWDVQRLLSLDHELIMQGAHDKLGDKGLCSVRQQLCRLKGRWGQALDCWCWTGRTWQMRSQPRQRIGRELALLQHAIARH